MGGSTLGLSASELWEEATREHLLIILTDRSHIVSYQVTLHFHEHTIVHNCWLLSSGKFNFGLAFSRSSTRGYLHSENAVHNVSLRSIFFHPCFTKSCLRSDFYEITKSFSDLATTVRIYDRIFGSIRCLVNIDYGRVCWNHFSQYHK